MHRHSFTRWIRSHDYSHPLHYNYSPYLPPCCFSVCISIFSRRLFFLPPTPYLQTTRLSLWSDDDPPFVSFFLFFFFFEIFFFFFLFLPFPHRRHTSPRGFSQLSDRTDRRTIGQRGQSAMVQFLG